VCPLGYLMFGFELPRILRACDAIFRFCWSARVLSAKNWNLNQNNSQSIGMPDCFGFKSSQWQKWTSRIADSRIRWKVPTVKCLMANCGAVLTSYNHARFSIPVGYMCGHPSRRQMSHGWWWKTLQAVRWGDAFRPKRSIRGLGKFPIRIASRHVNWQYQ